MERNEICWCCSGKKYKKCHMPIEEKMLMHAERGEIVPSKSLLKTPAQIEKIRESAVLNTAVLDEVAKHIRIGMSTAEIDEIVYRFTTEHGGIPAPLNYQGFPKSVCTSLNNEICHGIPDENIIIQEGDIINVDVSTILDGYFSDASRMFKMGKVSDRAERLVRVTEECVELGLAAAKPWGHLGDIADAINTHAKANGYSVVEEIGGHGIGLAFHEDPFVSYVTPKGSEMLLVPGMMFTIEPMINEGSPDFFVDEDNGITAGMSGYSDGIRFWAGSQMPDDAPFRVDYKGRVWATDGTFSGDLSAKMMTLKRNTSGTSEAINGALVAIFDNLGRFPEISGDDVMVIEILYPLMTRAIWTVTLMGVNSNVYFAPDNDVSDAVSSLTIGNIQGCYFRCFGFNYNGKTYWSVMPMNDQARIELENA